MRTRFFLLACCLAALAASPAHVFADAWCSDPPPYQYQSCGTVAPTNTFTVNSVGVITGVRMFFGDYHADFSSSINALVWRNGQLIYSGLSSPLNDTSHLYQSFQLVPSDQVQVGDQIEFVLHVNDPNGAQDYYSSQLSKNSDGLNHVWAETLSNGRCQLFAASCVYAGFEDLPMQEGSDFDYNDFMAWMIGINVSNGNQVSSVPEPSSILLLTGAPLAFALGKFRRLF